MVAIKKNYLDTWQIHDFALAHNATLFDRYNLIKYNKQLKQKEALTTDSKERILLEIDLVHLNERNSLGRLKIDLLIHYVFV